MNKKKKILLIGVVVLVVIAAIALFLAIYNKDSNKLKRYLKHNGYTCNEKVCNFNDDGVVYTIDYHNGLYTVTGITYLQIDPVKNNATYYGSNVTEETQQCFFSNTDASVFTKFTESDTSSNCTNFLGFVNREVGKYQTIIVKSKVDISKLK